MVPKNCTVRRFSHDIGGSDMNETGSFYTFLVNIEIPGLEKEMPELWVLS